MVFCLAITFSGVIATQRLIIILWQYYSVALELTIVWLRSITCGIIIIPQVILRNHTIVEDFDVNNIKTGWFVYKCYHCNDWKVGWVSDPHCGPVESGALWLTVWKIYMCKYITMYRDMLGTYNIIHISLHSITTQTCILKLNFFSILNECPYRNASLWMSCECLLRYLSAWINRLVHQISRILKQMVD